MAKMELNNLEQIQRAHPSFYEYLLKAWIQGNKTETVKHYRKMWETSMEGLQSLAKRTTPSFTYICEKNGNSLHDKMDELACFVPSMLALGSSGYGPEKSKLILILAEEVTAVIVRDGTRIPADMVVVGIRIRANTTLFDGVSSFT